MFGWNLEFEKHNISERGLFVKHRLTEIRSQSFRGFGYDDGENVRYDFVFVRNRRPSSDILVSDVFRRTVCVTRSARRKQKGPHAESY